jgi:FkbM family methyltransferase
VFSTLCLQNQGGLCYEKLEAMQSSPVNYEVLVQETYEAILRNGDIAIDVGAHRGRHCLVMAEKVFPAGKVLAFEPLPMCRAGLEKEIAEYRPELAHILKVHPYALSDFAGHTEFVVAKDALAYSGLKKRQYDGPTELEHIPIDVKRLDDMCENLASVRYIKIDAEGGEYHILKGAVRTLQRCRPAVAFEFGVNSLAEYKVTPLQMAQFWTDQRYKVYDIRGTYLTEQEFVVSAERQLVWDYVAIPAEDVGLQRTLVGILSGPPDWHRVSTHLDNADHHVKMADGVPRFVGFRGIKGWLVKRLAKLIIHGNQFVTGPQRACNQSLLYSGRALLKIVRDRAQEAACQGAKLAELAGQVTEMRQQLMRQAELLEQAKTQLAKLGRAASKEGVPEHGASFDRAA